MRRFSRTLRKPDQEDGTMERSSTTKDRIESRRATWPTKTALLCMTAGAAIALSLAAASAEPAPSQPVKNIVLVHGAFADGSSWAKVITILQAKVGRGREPGPMDPKSCYACWMVMPTPARD
jgi:hypothetical protein